MVGSCHKNARKQTCKESTELAIGTEVKTWTARNMWKIGWEDVLDRATNRS